MKSVVMLIAITLLPSVVFAQTISQSSGDPEIRSAIADCQRRGERLKVTLISGETLIGKRVRMSQDSFQITVGKEEKTIAYSDVRGAGSYFPQSKTVWSRLGRGLEASVGFAAIGTLVGVSYPTTKLAEHRANVQARSLETKIKNALPQRSSKSDVIAFLNSTKVGYKDLVFDASPAVDQNQQNINLITATIHRRNGFSFYAYYIRLTFCFDDSDRLVEYKVELVEDGL